MGNAQSDAVEKDVHEFVNLVPVLNVPYNIIRAPVYAGKGNGDEAVKSAIGIPTGLAAAGATVIGGPGAGVAANTASAAFTKAAGFGYDKCK
jgi:hypothetical protein